MPFILSLFPPEINTLIASFLNTNDIVSLCECGVRLDVTRHFYNNAFHDDTLFSHYDQKMFEQQARANLFLIGDSYCSHDSATGVPQNYEQEPGSTSVRIYKPCKAERHGIIVKACLGEQRAAILNTSGEVYFSRNSADFGDPPMKEPKVLYKARAREDDLGNLPQTGYYRIQGITSDVLEESYKWLNTPFKKTCFTNIDVSSGYNIFGTDDAGLVWQWASDWDPIQGIPVVKKRMFESGYVDSDIQRISFEVGFDVKHTLCMVGREGIMNLEFPFRRDDGSPNEWEGGYPCFDGGFFPVSFETVEGINAEFKDFIAMNGNVVILSVSGAVSEFPVDLDSCCDPHIFDKLNSLGPFVQISGESHNIGLITADKRAVIATIKYKARTHFEPRIVDSLNNVVSLSVCQDHFMALTEEGDVYSWGKECYCNGSLGLGKLEEILKLPYAHIEKRSLVADKPTKVDLPGRAYAIVTRNEHSVVLVHDEKEEEERKRKKEQAELESKRQCVRQKKVSFAVRLERRIDNLSEKVDKLEKLLEKQTALMEKMMESMQNDRSNL